MYPVCIDCQLEMTIMHNGIQLLCVDEDVRGLELYASDVYACQECGKQVALPNRVPSAYRNNADKAYDATDPTRRFIIRRTDQRRMRIPKERRSVTPRQTDENV